MSEPITREEKYLSAIASGGSTDMKPVTREEVFLAKATGQNVAIPEPRTRKEVFLRDVALSGAGGSSVILKSKEITANGEYSAIADGADGFSSVKVNVAGGSGGTGGEIGVLVSDKTSPNYTNVVEGLICPNSIIFSIDSFSGQGFLKFVDAPNATEINRGAFASCSKLASVNLPSARTIHSNAFMDCIALTSIDLPDAYHIGNGAFVYCKSFDTLILRNSVQVCNLDLTAILDTKIATEEGVPTGEGFIYVPTKFYENYVADFTQQIVAGFGLDEATADYMARAILRKIEDYPEICG